MTCLRRVYLYGNGLVGTIPEGYDGMGTLEVLEIHANTLEGSMPLSICNAVRSSDYEFKVLSVDCAEIQCDWPKGFPLRRGSGS